MGPDGSLNLLVSNVFFYINSVSGCSAETGRETDRQTSDRQTGRQRQADTVRERVSREGYHPGSKGEWPMWALNKGPEWLGIRQ